MFQSPTTREVSGSNHPTVTQARWKKRHRLIEALEFARQDGIFATRRAGLSDSIFLASDGKKINGK